MEGFSAIIVDNEITILLTERRDVIQQWTIIVTRNLATDAVFEQTCRDCDEQICG